MIHRLVNRPISHADRRGNTPQAGSNLGLGLLDAATIALTTPTPKITAESTDLRP
jgi:hypothetical protein